MKEWVKVIDVREKGEYSKRSRKRPFLKESSPCNESEELPEYNRTGETG